MPRDTFTKLIALILGAVSCGIVAMTLVQSRALAQSTASTTIPKPSQIEGQRTRPAESIKHDDLDEAWAQYEASIEALTKTIRAALEDGFEKATEKGDLDEAEKWQDAIQVFEEHGVFLGDQALKAVKAEAEKKLAEADAKLSLAYSSVIKELTKQKRIAEAKDVRAERTAVAATAHVAPDGIRKPSRSSVTQSQKTAFKAVFQQRKQEYAKRSVPPLDRETQLKQVENIADFRLRKPSKVSKWLTAVIDDDDGLFRDLVQAVESKDDAAILKAYNRFPADRTAEMDALINETDWGRWNRGDTKLTNGQVVLAAVEAVLRGLDAAERAGIIK